MEPTTKQKCLDAAAKAASEGIDADVNPVYLAAGIMLSILVGIELNEEAVERYAAIADEKIAKDGLTPS